MPVRPSAPVAAPDAPRVFGPAVQAALDHAGANKQELLKALRQTPADQRQGMEFLVANMPRPDLEALKADFLLENTALAYQVLGQVPWGKKIPKEIFLNEILPYANINERRDNWPRISSPASCRW